MVGLSSTVPRCRQTRTRPAERSGISSPALLPVWNGSLLISDRGKIQAMPLEEPNVPAAGAIFGHYVIEKKLAEGAFGIVYKGRDIRLDRPVAVKLLRGYPPSGQGWSALLQEARTASALNHPNICAIYDVGEESEYGFIAMEYIEGRTLQELVTSGALTAKAALAYGVQVAGALAHAHKRGIVHRDLKASNVMVTAEGHAKLLDFGLAARLAGEEFETVKRSRQSLAEFGGWAGTLPYVAPEVLHGKPTGVQSDLWAFGALLYEMLTGTLPFRGGTPFELSMSIMADPTPPLPPGTPGGIRAAVRRCLEKDTDRRYHDASEVLEDLLREQSQLAGAFRRPRRRWIAAAATSAVALSFAAVLGLHERRSAPAGSASSPTVSTAARPAPITAPSAPPAVKPAARPSAALHHSPRPQNPTQGNPRVEVWVNDVSGVYHCPGSRWYRKTASGESLTQRQAEEKGFRPANGRFCP